MRKLSLKRRRLAAVIGGMIPALALMSHHAHTPLNDSLVGLGVGVLVGLSGMSIFLLRRRSACENQIPSAE